MKPAFPLFFVCALAACGPADNEPGPGGVTVGEARALDDAAEMLEARRLPPEAIVREPVETDPANPPRPESSAPSEE